MKILGTINSLGVASVIIIASTVVGMLIYAAAILRPEEWVFHDPRIEVINGCQYIKTPQDNGGYNLVHAGNCTNEVHAPR